MNKAFRIITKLLATLLGSGLIPFMPGTMGSIFAFAVYLLMPAAWFLPAAQGIFAGALALFCLFSVWISSLAEREMGHDAPQIVIDEMCGFLVAVLFMPKTLMIGLYGLVLFRVFDIAKPFPISRLQKLPRGWGVVADDLAAGVVANILIRIMLYYFPKYFGI